MSGIYIKGIKMPQPKFADMVTVYDAYILVNPNGRAVIVVDDEDGLNSTEYTLTSVSSHGRLIEESKVLDIVSEWCPDDDGSVGKGGDLREMLDEIEALPTIISAEEGE